MEIKARKNKKGPLSASPAVHRPYSLMSESQEHLRHEVIPSKPTTNKKKPLHYGPQNGRPLQPKARIFNTARIPHTPGARDRKDRSKHNPTLGDSPHQKEQEVCMHIVPALTRK